MEEFCPQCGAGKQVILPASSPAAEFEKPQIGEPYKKPVKAETKKGNKVGK
jgi:hypothetical protein